MAESEIEAIDQTNQLKDRIDTKCKALPQQERLPGYVPGLGGSSIGGPAAGV